MEQFIIWLIGLVIIGWHAVMGLSALLRTKSAQKWFGEMLEQGSVLMRVNGIGLLIIAASILANLLLPARFSVVFVKWAVFGIIISQLSTLFMQIRKRHQIPHAAMAGPIVLIALTLVYWLIRT